MTMGEFHVVGHGIGATALGIGDIDRFALAAGFNFESVSNA